MQVNLHAAFFLFYIFRLLCTRGIFLVGCRHFVPALGFASSNPAGCTIFQKIPVKNPKAAYASKLARRFFLIHLQVNKTTGFAGEYRKNL